MSMNLSLFVGNLARDPDLKETKNGNSVTNFTIVTNRSFKNKDTGKYESVPTFHNCVAWGATGEFVNNNFKKGDSIGVHSEHTVETWDDKDDGKPRSASKFVVYKVEFVGARKSTKDGSEETNKASKPKSEKNNNEEEIPF